MLTLKRLFTAAVIFPVLFAILMLGALAAGGAIVGVRAAAGNQKVKDYQSGYSVGNEAGRQFGQRYGKAIFISVLAISAFSALAISFSDALPWCRRKLPSLPPSEDS